MIKIYNTLMRKKEVFKPIEDGKVKMYVCGPTVYSFIHIGNARPLVFFDTVRRYLEEKGYEVSYVQNFTDVDDKIINKANELGKPATEISEMYIEEFFRDIAALNLKKATYHPKVTENIEEIKSFIDKLVANGNAYQSGNDVYFKTKSFERYGQLSKQSIDDLISGARVELGEQKENPLDFALWKGAKPGEIYWESDWGQGRPGWHIECSTMVKKYLGETIDIHGGGADLVFPHHENEIAQSESLNHQSLANYWMHNGYININEEKMSKSLGNVLTVRDLIEKEGGVVLRYLLLSVHYRNPISFSDEILLQARNSLERIKSFYNNLTYRLSQISGEEEGDINPEIENKINTLKGLFIQEMDDDFNTANAITVIFDLIKTGNLYIQQEAVSKQALIKFKGLLDKWLEILGLELVLDENLENDPEHDLIEKLIAERNEARNNKNWSRADEIRDLLNDKGIIIEDTAQGVRWRKK